MKKSVLLAILAISISFASQAQTTQTETKVKPTSTPKQTVHNAFHKHKQHNGYKVKTTKNGVTHVKKVKTEKQP